MEILNSSMGCHSSGAKLHTSCTNLAFGEAVAAASPDYHVLVLGHLWPLLRPMAMGQLQTMADALQWLPWKKLLFFFCICLKEFELRDEEY